MQSTLTIDQTVRHPSRGTGTIVTLVYSPLRPTVPHKAWVEFAGIGFGACTVRFCCFVDDLTVVPATATPPARPTLVAVEPIAPQVA